MPPRSRSRSTSQPPAKRTKLFRACSACVASKTRCEDVVAGGCALCRRRGKECSLAAVVSALDVGGVASTGAGSSSLGVGASAMSLPTPAGSAVSASASMPLAYSSATSPSTTSELAELRARLAAAEARVARTESALRGLTPSASSPSLRRRSCSPSSPEFDPDLLSATRSVMGPLPLRIAGPLRLAGPLLYSLEETMFSLPAALRYPSPISRGIPRPHADMGWHAFKARIAPLLPLPPFLGVATAPPEHGFVLAAALAHVPMGRYAPTVRSLADECVALAMGGAAGVDVMLALLVLSLAPLDPDPDTSELATSAAAEGEAVPRTPSPIRLVALAYSMGLGLGMDAMAEAAVRYGDELNDEWRCEALWHLQLWSAIVNRHALLSMLYGQAKPPPLIAPRLPALRRESLEACNTHLRAEAALVSIFSPLSDTLSALERGEEYPPDRVKALQDVWRRTQEDVHEFIGRGAPKPLQIDARCLEFSFALRITSLTTWIPSPLIHAREGVLRCVTKMPAIMSNVIDIVTPYAEHLASVREHADHDRSHKHTRKHSPSQPPAPLPGYVVMLATAALVCMRRAVQFVAVAYRQFNFVNSAFLENADTTLRTMGAAPRWLLTHTSKLLDENPYHLTLWHDAAPPNVHDHNTNAHEVPIEGWDLDLFSWDLSLLYPDIGFSL